MSVPSPHESLEVRPPGASVPPAWLHSARWALGWLSGFALMAGFITGEGFATHALNGDSWWSWAVGRYEHLHHTIVTYNVLSNGPALTHAPWTNLEWGWQWLLAAFGGTGAHPSPAGFLILGILASVLGWFALAGGLRVILGRWDVGKTLWLLIPTGIFWVNFYSTLRPQLLSGVFWIALLALLWTAQGDRRWLLLAPLLALVWSPFHGDWVLVPALIVVDGFWQALLRQSGVLWRWGIGVASVLLPALLSPFGLHGVRYILWLDQNPWIHDIVEWQPPNFATGQFEVWLAALAIGTGLIIWRTVQQPTTYRSRLWLWYGGTLVMLLMERRMALYFAPVFGWMVAMALPTPSWTWRPKAWMAAGLAGVLAVGWLAGFAASPTPYVQPLTPVFRWAARHRTSGLTLVAPVFAGQWEATAPPGLGPVFTDGRADFFLKQAPSRIPWETRFFTVGVLPTSFAREDLTRIIWEPRRSTWPAPAYLSLQAAHWHRVWTHGNWTVWEPSRLSPK